MGYLIDIPGIEVIVPLLAAGLIGLAASRNHYKKKLSKDLDEEIKLE